jgi:hypothetical protein
MLARWEIELLHADDQTGPVPSEVFQDLKKVIFHEDHGETEIPGYVWVDSRYIRDLLGAGKAQHGAAIELVLKAFDAFNELYRTLILYLAPKYGLNAAGNMLMGLMRAGPGFHYWAWRGMTLPQRLSESDVPMTSMRRIISYIDGTMGETKTLSFGQPATRITRTLQGWWNTLTDLWYRRAWFLREAALRGYVTDEQLLELFRIDPRGRFVHESTLNDIGLSANRNAVDFDNALTTSAERDVLRRLLIFYPWTRSAIEWTLRIYGESPAVQLASAIMTAQAERMDLAPLPRWARSAGMVIWFVGKDKAKSINFSSIYTPLTLAQTLDVLDELAGIVFRGEKAQGDIARALQSGLNVVFGPIFGEQRRGTIGGFIPEFPLLSAFRGSPTFPTPTPLRLIGGGLVPRDTAFERLRQQHEKELGKGVNEQRRWQRYGDRLIAIYSRLQGLDEPTRRALKLAFKLRSEAAFITAREGGEATPERKMLVLEALLKRAEELQPEISKLFAFNVPVSELAQAYREAVQRELAALGLNLASKDERERAAIVDIIEGWQTKVINKFYGGEIVNVLISRLSRVPGVAAEAQLLSTD